MEQATNEDTTTDAIAAFHAAGYTGQFWTRPTGHIHCGGCGDDVPPKEIRLEDATRLEGNSDPDDEVLVTALTCRCGARGTEAFSYGPEADPVEAEALRDLNDVRKTHA